MEQIILTLMPFDYTLFGKDLTKEDITNKEVLKNKILKLEKDNFGLDIGEIFVKKYYVSQGWTVLRCIPRKKNYHPQRASNSKNIDFYYQLREILSRYTNKPSSTYTGIEYQGIPDFFIHNPKTKDFLFVEVKQYGCISDKQIFWKLKWKLPFTVVLPLYCPETYFKHNKTSN
jgi:hypothetical protein